MKTSLIEKYDVPTPRYTSYPPVPLWEKKPSLELWLDHLRLGLAKPGNAVDLYVHIPFCKELCHYCGCNRQQCDDKSLMENYVETLLSEWGGYKEKLKDFRMASLHLGGGTPTWLPVSLLGKLLEGLSSERLSGSCELDPRVTSQEHLKLLYQKGLRRLSLGVQDFHPEVQRLIGRRQSFESVNNLVREARALGFEEFNFDLIYGLPGQSLETLEETFSAVAKLRPETLAFYSFAYVPHFASNQKNIDVSLVPVGEKKRALFERGCELLAKEGYREIGMDHFALESSSLFRAFKEGRLKRNFMGYTVSKAPILLGLGTSAISSSGLSFIQNEKDIKLYTQSLKNGTLPFVKGHIQTGRDLEIELMIQELMCKGETELKGGRPESLQPLLEDKLIELEGRRLRVSELGRPFLRNIARSLDERQNQSSGVTFSRSV